MTINRGLYPNVENDKEAVGTIYGFELHPLEQKTRTATSSKTVDALSDEILTG